MLRISAIFVVLCMVLIAGAGGAAHLPGMVASHTVLPVLGVPVESKALKGLDSLLSIAQMPGGVPVGTLAERIRHVVQSAFNGRRIVIFSGGAKGADEKIFEECKGIRDGGGFGSIIGRNSFQRPKKEALEFLAKVMKIYA